MGNKNKKSTNINNARILSFDRERFIWGYHNKILLNHGYFSFDINELCNKISPKLNEYANMTWSDLKSKADSCHSSDTDRLFHNKDFEKIVRELWNGRESDIPETFFQLRITSIHRVFGIRKDSVFLLLINDSNHQIDPSHKKHT